MGLIPLDAVNESHHTRQRKSRWKDPDLISITTQSDAALDFEEINEPDKSRHDASADPRLASSTARSQTSARYPHESTPAADSKTGVTSYRGGGPPTNTPG